LVEIELSVNLSRPSQILFRYLQPYIAYGKTIYRYF